MLSEEIWRLISGVLASAILSGVVFYFGWFRKVVSRDEFDKYKTEVHALVAEKATATRDLITGSTGRIEALLSSIQSRLDSMSEKLTRTETIVDVVMENKKKFS